MPLQQANVQVFLEIGDPLGDCRRGKMFALVLGPDGEHASIK
jgi:hypothetical protein